VGYSLAVSMHSSYFLYHRKGKGKDKAKEVKVREAEEAEKLAMVDKWVIPWSY